MDFIPSLLCVFLFECLAYSVEGEKNLCGPQKGLDILVCVNTLGVLDNLTPFTF